MGSSLVLNRRPKVPAEDTAAFGAIAERFRRGGALEQAVSLCRDGLKKFPDHVSARVTLGWALLDLGKYEEARVELEQVMRRAPDNLAAIRGLAELHDRFEHTLNLSMDGPGAWPPPADAVDEVGASAEDAALSYDDGVVATAPTMAPPDLGLPLWSPEPAAESVVEAVANTQIQTPASGMSSVREIDAFAGVPAPAIEVEQEEAPVAELPVTMSSVEQAGLGVSDDALAALIAEADSLDAVAELEVAATPSEAQPEIEAPVVALAATDAIELESPETTEFAAVAEQPIELAPAENVELVAETFEFDSTAVEIEMEPVVFEPAAVKAAEPEISEPEPVATEEIGEEEQAVAFVEPPVVAEVEPEIVAEVEPEVVAQIEPEVVAVFEAPVVAEPEPEIVVLAEPEVVAAAEPVAEAEAEPEPEFAVAAMVDTPAAVAVAEVLAFVRPEVPETPIESTPVAVSASRKKGEVTILALERMLRRVQARRLELMAESVA
ncbi:MAG TPA: tetratricopeptide repeat protein [Vicinamibacterales bacterium]|nr:tetratricopeptide repeat protein [Vicinamibacterales bacterium]